MRIGRFLIICLLGALYLPNSAMAVDEARTLKDELLASPSTTQPPASAGRLKLMDIAFVSLFTAGGSTASEGDIDKLQGGAHDPKRRGFTVQNLELSMLGAVDPHLNGEVHLVYQIDKEGESKLEVEEAFLTTPNPAVRPSDKGRCVLYRVWEIEHAASP